jgi:predicted RNase H-like HicB family nuclease
MNDHDAMTAINEALAAWFEGEFDHAEALLKIAYISGQNAISHAEANEAQK